MGPKAFQWEGVIKIWTRGQILLKDLECSKLLQIERECRPCRCEPNATCLGSNGCQEWEISRSIQNGKQAKKRGADCTVRTDIDVAGRTTRGRKLLDSWHVTSFVGSEWDGNMWPNQWPPHVTYLLVKIFALGRSRPRDLRGRVKLWERPPNRCSHTYYLIYICVVIYLTSYKCVLGCEPGRG